jgi:hypothetical protein
MCRTTKIKELQFLSSDPVLLSRVQPYKARSHLNPGEDGADERQVGGLGRHEAAHVSQEDDQAHLQPDDFEVHIYVFCETFVESFIRNLLRKIGSFAKGRMQSQ